jgi:hypothetical protein
MWKTAERAVHHMLGITRLSEEDNMNQGVRLIRKIMASGFTHDYMYVSKNPRHCILLSLRVMCMNCARWNKCAKYLGYR